jgi:hypothetical protein
MSLEFFIDIILSHYGAGVDPVSNRNEYQDYFLWGKGGRCLGLTTLPPSCADCLEIWERQPSGNFRACPGLYKVYFTLQLNVCPYSVCQHFGQRSIMILILWKFLYSRFQGRKHSYLASIKIVLSAHPSVCVCTSRTAGCVFIKFDARKIYEKLSIDISDFSKIRQFERPVYVRISTCASAPLPLVFLLLARTVLITVRPIS